MQQTLAGTENAENYRRDGELLTTLMARIPKEATEVELPNYHEEDAPLRISLNPALSSNRDARKHFQKYQKLKNTVRVIKTQTQQTQQETFYLESVVAQLEIAIPMDIEVIRGELIGQGYLKRKKNKEQKQPKKSQPDLFYVTDDTPILARKNNLQNDQLTLQTAKKTDYWLHAKDIPGSHVITRDVHPSKETLTEAALLTAYFSKYRLSSQVPADYVQVKHVHKPDGAKPGCVTYGDQRTLYVTPTEESIKKIQQNKASAS